MNPAEGPTESSIYEGLLSEYPLLITWDIRVQQRFEAGPGRISNAYLVSANPSASGLEQFVAKYGPTEPGSSRGVATEWRALKLACAGATPTSALLFENQRPKEILLVEMLAGMDGESAVTAGLDVNEIFGLIGETLRQLHAIRTAGFGDLESPCDHWASSTIARVESKLESLAGVLDEDLLQMLKVRIEELIPGFAQESREPRLIHRDIYLSNFIVDPDASKASIIDFGMACGGRPLYDLAKFFILDLYRYPHACEPFLSRYYADSAVPDCFQPLIKLYLYVELLGMIRYFHAIGQRAPLLHANRVLKELLVGQGLIVDLISN